MQRGQGERVPFPTDDEITTAIDRGREIVAYSAVRYGALIALNIACNNGDTATAILDPVGQSHLLSVLKALIPDIDSIRAAPVTRGELGPQARAGHQSG
jgi:hypothetical protein